MIHLLLHLVSIILVGLSVYGWRSSGQADNFIIDLIGGSDNLIILYIATVIVIAIDFAYPKLKAMKGES